MLEPLKTVRNAFNLYQALKYSIFHYIYNWLFNENMTAVWKTIEALPLYETH